LAEEGVHIFNLIFWLCVFVFCALCQLVFDL
jgi:hypothetical protein